MFAISKQSATTTQRKKNDERKQEKNEWKSSQPLHYHLSATTVDSSISKENKVIRDEYSTGHSDQANKIIWDEYRL